MNIYTDELIKKSFDDHRLVLKEVYNINLITELKICSRKIVNALNKGGKIIWFGNGGSASDGEHLSAEFVGRFKKNRRPLASLALSSNSSIFTAIANDFGFIDIYSRQIEAIASSVDIAIGISTSGNSENILRGIKKANEMNVSTIGFLGNDGGYIKDFVDNIILIESNDTARIQEMHILIGHILCELVESEISK